MSASTRSIVPDTLVPGAVSHAETAIDHLTARRSRTVRDVINRAACGDYPGWLDHVRAAPAVPDRSGSPARSTRSTPPPGRSSRSTDTATMPDGVIYKACGNRRATVCPSCSTVYQYDAYQLLRAGLAGGKTIPDTVSSHPAVFATFTAPSFGTVHSRVVTTHTCRDRTRCRCRPQPCHIRRNHGTCQHGQPAVCFTRHRADDPLLGEPLCLDCYDHDHQVVWNLHAGELWRRTKQAIERHLTHLAKQRGLMLRVDRRRTVGRRSRVAGAGLARQGRRIPGPRRHPLPRPDPPRRRRPRRPGRDRPATGRHHHHRPRRRHPSRRRPHPVHHPAASRHPRAGR